MYKTKPRSIQLQVESDSWNLAMVRGAKCRGGMLEERRS